MAATTHAGPHLWLRSETKPNEHRSALTPVHCRSLISEHGGFWPSLSEAPPLPPAVARALLSELGTFFCRTTERSGFVSPLLRSDSRRLPPPPAFPGFRVTVERCPQRVFADAEFEAVGCVLADRGSWKSAPRDAYIIGLKELPEGDSSPLSHCHIFFAHCYKNQAGWRELLRRFVNGGGTLLDLEFLQDERGGPGHRLGICQTRNCHGLAAWRSWDFSHNVYLKYCACFSTVVRNTGRLSCALQVGGGPPLASTRVPNSVLNESTPIWTYAQRSSKFRRTPLLGIKPFSEEGELLKHIKGRLQAAGYGEATAYDCFMYVGLPSALARAYQHRCFSLDRVDPTASQLKILVIGALGRCGSGAVDFARKVGIPNTDIICWDMAETAKGGPFREISDVANIFINCIYLSEKIPPFIDPTL
ncbi:MAG: hypothetical protein BJ554DRAFT_4370, partial [Olpidium bornovanus]